MIGERHAAALVIMDMRQSAGRKSPTARDEVGRGIIVAPFGDERWSPKRLRHALADRAQGERRAHGDELAHLSGMPRRLQIGRPHVCTPVTTPHIVCRHPLEQKKEHTTTYT